MSVQRSHEAVCFDSAQIRFFFYDHFLGDQLKDEWDVTVVGGGTVAVVDAQSGGIVRLTSPTNATGDSARIDWNAIRSLHVSKRMTFEFRLKLSSATQIQCAIFLIRDNNNFIRFELNRGGAAGNWVIRCQDNGASAGDLNTGITGDTNYHIFRIKCHLHGGSHVHFYIDGVETNNSPITTNIPDDAGDYLQPRILCLTNDINTKSVDIDYVGIRQDR